MYILVLLVLSTVLTLCVDSIAYILYFCVSLQMCLSHIVCTDVCVVYSCVVPILVLHLSFEPDVVVVRVCMAVGIWHQK